MSSSGSGSASNSASPSSSASQNLSNVLGSITDSSSGSASATQSSGSSSSASASASGSATITNAPSLSTGSSSSVGTLSGAPSLTSGQIPSLTGLPTLSGYYSYPAPTVPPLSNAPYLQKTNIPENFMFIIVGVAIAFVGILIVGWRVFTSWSINRRFQRHEGGFSGHHAKAAYTPLSELKQHPPSTSHDTKDMGNLPKTFSSVPSLFFSPTLEVAKNSMRPPSSRTESRHHLPSGHYRDISEPR